MKILPIFIPHRGCPFKCIYCNQYAITNTNKPDLKNLANQIKQFSNNSDKNMEIAFYGGTFTGLSNQEQQQLLQVTNRLAPNIPIRISTRPDFISEEILFFLKNHNVQTIELGIQSFSDIVLINSKRGYSSKQAEKACSLVKKSNFKLSIQLMPGLPGFSNDTLNTTLKKTLILAPEYVRIYPTVVLKNTELEKLYLQGLYTPLSIDNAVNIVTYMINFFKNSSITVIKSGLHSDINDVIAGPYHHSFGELVKMKILKEEILSSYRHEKTLVISNRDISLFLGFDKKMLKSLKKELNSNKIPVKLNNKLKSGSFYFSDDKPEIFW